jgi:hypothetical protein
MLESRIHDKYTTPNEIQMNEREQLEREAVVALALIERWGMVAAVEDGEDSTGRAKVRMSTPEELVDRAFTVAKLAMDRARRDNLVHIFPSLEEL